MKQANAQLPPSVRAVLAGLAVEALRGLLTAAATPAAVRLRAARMVLVSAAANAVDDPSLVSAAAEALRGLLTGDATPPAVRLRAAVLVLASTAPNDPGPSRGNVVALPAPRQTNPGPSGGNVVAFPAPLQTGAVHSGGNLIAFPAPRQPFPYPAAKRSLSCARADLLPMPPIAA